MGDMLDTKFWGGGDPKKIHMSRADSSEEKTMDFLTEKASPPLRNLLVKKKKCNPKTMLSGAIS